MPRIRWALRCRARSRRSGGNRCAAWAVRGAYVCKVHGGSLRRTRQEAMVRLLEKALNKEFAVVYRKWQEAVRQFHVDRILTTSRLLGIPPERVDMFDIIECRRRHGVPPYEDQAPTLADVPRDKRYNRRLPVR